MTASGSFWFDGCHVDISDYFDGCGFFHFPPQYATLATSDYDAKINYTELRSDTQNQWGTDISAGSNDSVDIRINALLDLTDPFAINSGHADVLAYADIYGRTFNSNWALIDSTYTKTETISVFDEHDFFWDNAFHTSSSYDQYKVIGYVRAAGEPFWDSSEGMIDQVNQGGACGSVEILSHSISLNENTTQSFEFTIQNNSGRRFTVDNFSIVETADFFSSSVSTQSFGVSAYGSSTGRFSVSGSSVSSDRSQEAFARIQGHFDDGLNCSYLDVGERSFSVSVRNSTSNDNLCNQVILNTFDVAMPDNSQSVKTFSISNNSDKRFFLQDVELTESNDFFSVTKNYFDPVISNKGSGIVQFQLSAPAISSTRTGSVSMAVRGEFENGASCSFDAVPSKNFSVTIQKESPSASCNAFLLHGDSFQLSENDSKTKTFLLQNNSNERFTVTQVDLTESNPNFAVELVSNDSTVEPLGTGSVRVRASTGTLDSSGSGQFTLRVRGSFSGGQLCTLQDLSSVIEVEYSENGGGSGGQAVCRNVDIESETIRLKGDETQTPFLTVRNHSSQTFFIENANVYDNSDAFSLHSTSFDAFADADGGSGSVWFSAEGLSATTEETGTGYAQVSGHFSDGTTCSFSEIGTQSFSVIVNPAEDSDVCSDFRYTVPQTVTVGSDSRASVSFRISNPTNEDVFLYLGGNNLSVSPGTFMIPRNGSINSSAQVSLLSSQNAILEYRVNSSGCNLQNRFTQIIRSTGGEPPVQGTIEIVSAPPQVRFSHKTTIPVTIKNLSNASQSVVVSIEGIPVLWTAEKPTQFFNALETRTVYVDVFSNGVFQSQSASVVVQRNNVELDRQSIGLSAVSSIPASEQVRLNVVSQVQESGDVSVTMNLTNISSGRQSGSVWLELPSDWLSAERQSFVLNAGESAQIGFLAKPQPGALDGTGYAHLKLDTGEESVVSFGLSDATGSAGFLSGLISFTGAFFKGGLWLLVLLVVVLVLFFVFQAVAVNANPPRQRFPPYSVVKKRLEIETKSGVTANRAF